MGLSSGGDRGRSVMTHIPTELLPVIQITLPLLAGMFLAGWMQNRRLDDIVARLVKLEERLGKVEDLLRALGERIARLEGGPLVRR